MKIIKKGCKSECEINSLMKKRLWRENMGEIETGRCWKKKKSFILDTIWKMSKAILNLNYIKV